MSIIEKFKSNISALNPCGRNRFEIYDIMAVAFYSIDSSNAEFDYSKDVVLTRIVKDYAKSFQYDRFKKLLTELSSWADGISKNYTDEQQAHYLFLLIRLIDSECVFSPSTSIEPYEEFLSLNEKHRDYVRILPRHESMISRLMGSAIKHKELSDGKVTPNGLWGRNHAITRGINAFINNFTFVYYSKEILPRFIVPNKTKVTDMEKGFINQDRQLKIAMFPLSGRNLSHMYSLNHVNSSSDRGGRFSVDGPLNHNTEDVILERCRVALEICRQKKVNIAVFPEMLFTSKIVNHICNDLRCSIPVDGNGHIHEPDLWFMWLGSAWEQKENKSTVIDGYGQKVLEHKKHVAFEHKKEGRKYIEDLKKESDPTLPIIDITNLLRMATAICRDVSNNHLTTLTKDIWSDMIVVPAFSPSNRITPNHVDSLVMEHIIAVVCNACSALCDPSQAHIDCIGKAGEVIDFCYLGLPKKVGEVNQPHYHELKFNKECQECAQHCHGRVFNISFSECAKEAYTPKVVEQ